MGKISLTFKTNKNTGLYAIGNPYDATDIKLNKKYIGGIYPPSWDSKNKGWVIRLLVVKKDIMEDGNPNCVWKTITFKRQFDSQELARIWLKENFERISKEWEIYNKPD